MSPSIIPYLYYFDASAALKFLERAFGFEVEMAFRDPDTNEVLHASVVTGQGIIFVGPGMKEFGTQGTVDANYVASMTYVFVENIDLHYKRSIDAGAILREEVHNHFGGNRQYTVSDPGGQRWTFAEPIENGGAWTNAK